MEGKGSPKGWRVTSSVLDTEFTQGRINGIAADVTSGRNCFFDPAIRDFSKRVFPRSPVAGNDSVAVETEDQSAERELADLEVHIERLQHEAATLEQRLAQIRKLIADFAAETGEE